MTTFLAVAIAVVLSGVVVYLLLERAQWSRLAAGTRDFRNSDVLPRRASFRSQEVREVLDCFSDLAEERDHLRMQVNEDTFNLDAILSSMTEGVMVVDREKHILLVNRSFNDLFSVSASPVGKSILMAIREAAIEEVVHAAIESSERQAREISLPGQSEAATRYFEISAVPVQARDGTTSGAVTVLHEITQLRQVEAIRREFVSNVSHELRTPLSIFHGYLENLIEQPDLPPREMGAALLVMRKHSQRLNALLEDLLTLARLESRRVSFDPVSIRVVPFLDQMIDDWKGRAAAMHRSIRREGESEVPPISADLMRLEQMLNNLIDNAIKYTSENGHIVVGAGMLGDQVEIWVQDSGIGIPPADLPHIFERFFRVDKARSRDAGGTGLGLSIVKHIAALHGGTVHAESEYGKGTRISLRFAAEEEMDW